MPPRLRREDVMTPPPPSVSTPPPLPAPAAPARRRRPWGAKFRTALRGVKLGVRGHSSFFVHFFAAAAVVAGALAFRCEWLDWCILLGCVGFVLTAELFNSAIETLFAGLDDATKERAWPALDVAAGAVLVASLAAAAVGLIVFIHRLAVLLGYA
jgi:diacylglycerol kinase